MRVSWAAMSEGTRSSLFDVRGLTVAITGGGGVLCGGIAEYLASCGMAVAVLDLSKDAAAQVADRIRKAGGKAVAVVANVLDG